MAATPLFALILAHAIAASPASAVDNDPGGKNEMSGYRFKAYQGFEKTWQLVTVRFRKDTKELRFVYANDKAWNAMQKGLAEYPEGAVFAKIGIATADDPTFPSSAVPNGARRFQLMVKDKKKHAATDGWGYALFDANGKTFPGDPNVAVQACAACHRLVPEKDYVFSEIAEISSFPPKEMHKSKPVSGKLNFVDQAVEQIPAAIRSQIPIKTKTVRVLTGDLTKTFFPGTLDEIRPALSNETVRSKIPALLVGSDGESYSIVYKNPDATLCSTSNPGQVDLIAVSRYKGAEKHSALFCAGPNDGLIPAKAENK